jgi:hypothetical protein
MARISSISVKRCLIKNGHLLPRGDIIVLSVDKAFELMAPSKTSMAKMNILKAKTGNFIGISTNNTNFRLVNQTTTGDIRWLLKKKPEFAEVTKEIYRVEDVVIPVTAQDLPGDPERV